MARKAGQIIARRQGTWLVRVYLGCDPQTGTRKYHNQTIRGPFREAQRFLNLYPNIQKRQGSAPVIYTVPTTIKDVPDTCPKFTEKKAADFTVRAMQPTETKSPEGARGVSRIHRCQTLSFAGR
jgi:hypothetical protein